MIRAAVERGMPTGEPWNLVLPFVTAAGRRLWVNSIGRIEFRATDRTACTELSRT